MFIFTAKELKINGAEVSVCEDVENFTWTYDGGYLFSSDDNDKVLEAYACEDSFNTGGVRMADRTEAVEQRWRLLNEYEDEDPEFRPAFAFGSHKMDTESSWSTTKRKCKPFMEAENPSVSDLTFNDVNVKDVEWKRPDEIARIVSVKFSV